MMIRGENVNMQMRAENIRFLHHIISGVPVHQIIVSANLFR